MVKIMEVTALDRLREAGIRVTAPRLRIYEFLLNNYTHPTCDDIYRSLSSEDSSLSLASVYNVTEKLEQAGLVRLIVSPDGQKHYDAKTDFHGHFCCKECGRMIDVSCCKDLGLKDLKGARIDSMNLLLSGVCKDCLICAD